MNTKCTHHTHTNTNTKEHKHTHTHTHLRTRRIFSDQNPKQRVQNGCRGSGNKRSFTHYWSKKWKAINTTKILRKNTNLYNKMIICKQNYTMCTHYTMTISAGTPWVLFLILNTSGRRLSVLIGEEWVQEEWVYSPPYRLTSEKGGSVSWLLEVSAHFKGGVRGGGFDLK